MKNIKKILSLFLVLAVVLSLFPATVFAAEADNVADEVLESVTDPPLLWEGRSGKKHKSAFVFLRFYAFVFLCFCVFTLLCIIYGVFLNRSRQGGERKES